MTQTSICLPLALDSTVKPVRPDWSAEIKMFTKGTFSQLKSQHTETNTENDSTCGEMNIFNRQIELLRKQNDTELKHDFLP